MKREPSGDFDAEPVVAGDGVSLSVKGSLDAGLCPVDDLLTGVEGASTAVLEAMAVVFVHSFGCSCLLFSRGSALSPLNLFGSVTYSV